MAGRPFLRAQLGNAAAIVTEIAPGADLSADPATWVWTDITPDVRHADGTTTTIGRADNVGTTPAAQHSCGLNNGSGNYSPANPVGAYWPNVTRNMPVRQRLTLNGLAFFTRFQGYLQSLVPGSDLSGKVSTVKLTAAGMLARIAGRKRPLRSPLYRSLIAAAPLAFWPMEEGTSATSIAAAVGKTMTFTTGVAPGAAAGPGTTACVDFSGGGTATAPVAGVTGNIHIGFAFKSLDIANNIWAGVSFQSGGYIFAASPFVQTDGSGQVTFSAKPISGAPGSATLITSTMPMTSGTWHYVSMDLIQNGANVDIKAGLDDQFGSLASFVTGVTLTGTTAVVLNNFPYLPPSSNKYAICQLAFFPSTTTSGDQAVRYAATLGNAGETADARLTRLCAEEGVALDLTGTSDVTMGPQPVATLLAILQECEAADHGILYDGLGPGLGYVCRSSVYRESIVYTLDMSAQQVTAPATGFLDMQGITNIVAASQPGGSTVTFERTDGPSGTDQIGDEDTTWTGNVADPGVLGFHAAFVAALGSPDGQRIPQIAPNVRILDQAKLTALLGAGPRHRVNIANPPLRELGPDLLDLLVEGWTETTTADHWTLVLNTSPFAPYFVAVVDDSTDRVAAGGDTTLAGWSLGTTGTGTVSVNVGALWSTAGGDYPSDVVIGGEVITLSGVSGASSPQTFTVSARSVNGVVKTHNAGDQVEVVHPAIVAL